jgi:hypothetical protein
VVLLAALAGAAGFIFGERTASSETTTVTVTETETETTTVTAPDASGLPDEVIQTYDELLGAARARDWDGLQRIIDRSGDEFSYTFGRPVEGGPIAYWKGLEREGQMPLETLAAVLSLPYTLSRGIFIWPFAFDKTPDEITQYEEVLLSRIPDGPKTVGPEGYLGWRAGIRPDGRWVFYVAGD